MSVDTWVQIGIGAFFVVTVVALTLVDRALRDRPKLRFAGLILVLLVICVLVLLAVGYAQDHIK